MGACTHSLQFLLLIGFCVVLPLALRSVAQRPDATYRPARTRVPQPWAGQFTTRARTAAALDLNLPGDLDHIFGRQIKAIDDFHRISIKKRKQRQTPAA